MAPKRAAPKTASEKQDAAKAYKVANRLLTQLKSGATLRGKPLTNEQIRSFCDQLKEYAETLNVPSYKVSLLNQMRGFKHNVECKELEESQKNITKKSEHNLHALKCALGALQNSVEREEEIVKESKAQEAKINEHSDKHQASTKEMQEHAEQAASSSDQHNKKEVAERLDKAQKDAIDGVVKMVYQSEKEQKRKHAKEIAELQNEHVKRLKIISIGKRAEREKLEENLEDNVEEKLEEKSAENLEDNVEENLEEKSAEHLAENVEEKLEDVEEEEVEFDPEEAAGELVEQEYMKLEDVPLKSKAAQEKDLERLWLLQYEVDNEEHFSNWKQDKIDFLKQRAREDEQAYWLARHRASGSLPIKDIKKEPNETTEESELWFTEG